jgi:hypothetical protein
MDVDSAESLGQDDLFCGGEGLITEEEREVIEKSDFEVREGLV